MVSDEPVAPSRLQNSVPRDLETICLKCLQKRPQQRYASALELAEDLRRAQAGEPIQARPVGRGERLVKWCRRHPAVAALSTVLVVLKVFGGLTNREVAESLNVTERTIERQWAYAKAWLFNAIRKEF